jgi:UPF0042 nucleotide-binding protein
VKFLIIVSGPSGAGKSTALHALEDLGYFGIANFPVFLLDPLTRIDRPQFEKVAVVMDLRDPDFLSSFERGVGHLQRQDINIAILFLFARENVLLSRFSQLRRPHPLFPDEPLSLAIAREQELLQPLRSLATTVIDTTALTPHQLKGQLKALFGEADGNGREMRFALYSFGFKHGMPPEADMVLDVRFLPNPYFVAEMKEKTGLERQVADYVLANDSADKFQAGLLPLLLFLLPQYAGEGKASFTIAIGCTGGRHRSVAVVELLQKKLAAAGFEGKIWHRELEEQ